MADKRETPPTDPAPVPGWDGPGPLRARPIAQPANPLWEPPRDDPRRDAPAPQRRQRPDRGGKDKPV